MENYIVQILESNSRVIVPEFGAFIVKQRTPYTVVFNEFLQYNDGVLIDVIAKNENISREDAKQKIDDFVKQINGTLDRGEVYQLGKLGVIVKGHSGKISLEKEAESGKTTRKGPDKVAETVQPKKKTATATKKPEAKPAMDETSRVVSTKKETIQKDEIIKEPEKTEEPEKKEDTKEEVTITEKITSQPVREEQKAPIEQKIRTPEPVPLSKTYEPVKEREIENAGKYKRSSIIIWVVIILIVNALLIAYFIYSDQLKGIFISKGQDTLTAEPMIREETKIPEQVTEEPVVTNESVGNITPEQKPANTGNHKKETPTGTRYYVVAGVFSEEKNADNLVKELRAKGYNSEKFGKIGNLHAVSYDVFNTKNEADRYLLKIHKESDPEAWIRTVR